MASLTHLDNNGNPTMVDVGKKPETLRTAVARSLVELNEEIMVLLENGEIQTKKGAVFQTAIIAGIMAAKKTGELIPLCHPIGMDNCKINIKVVEKNTLEIICEASVFGKTGIEMEALTGASIAALTVYDMCKAMSHNIIIKDTRLLQKTGGKKDFKI
jgi:cyclic pyranopterin phosphate synthase